MTGGLALLFRLPIRQKLNRVSSVQLRRSVRALKRGPGSTYGTHGVAGWLVCWTVVCMWGRFWPRVTSRSSGRSFAGTSDWSSLRRRPIVVHVPTADIVSTQRPEVLFQTLTDLFHAQAGRHRRAGSAVTPSATPTCSKSMHHCSTKLISIRSRSQYDYASSGILQLLSLISAQKYKNKRFRIDQQPARQSCRSFWSFTKNVHFAAFKPVRVKFY